MNAAEETMKIIEAMGLGSKLAKNTKRPRTQGEIEANERRKAENKRKKKAKRIAKGVRR